MVNLRAFCLLFAILTVLFSMTACAVPQSADVLAAGCGGVSELPAGQRYSLSGDDNTSLLDDALIAQLFGTGTLPPERALWEDAAICLSYTAPFEIGVFRCRQANDTEAVAKLCLRRIAVLRAFWEESADASEIPDGTVTVHGRWVFLCFSAENDKILRAMRRAL